ncbi:hypothetical protein ACHQM5_017603 [Ranunculus cassubicifolius]
MQKALPYRMWLSTPSPAVDNPVSLRERNFMALKKEDSNSNEGSVKDMVMENAVVLFGRRGCCMCHAMKRLLLMLGVNPAVYEVDDEEAVTEELLRISGDEKKGDKPQFPFMFIGGKLFGGLDRLMAAHISGELIPMLKQAGALWL